METFVTTAHNAIKHVIFLEGLEKGDDCSLYYDCVDQDIFTVIKQERASNLIVDVFQAPLVTKVLPACKTKYLTREHARTTRKSIIQGFMTLYIYYFWFLQFRYQCAYFSLFFFCALVLRRNLSSTALLFSSS